MQPTWTQKVSRGISWQLLEMPVPAVLAILWLAGVAIVCACTLILYALVSSLA